MKTRTARIVAVLLLLVALYALAGFVIAPKLVRSALLEDIPQTLPHVRPSVGEIHINPFLFEVEVKDFALADEAGAKLIGFDRLYVKFLAAASLWRRAYSFGRIALDAPVVNARVAKNGTLNLLALRPPPKQRLSTKAQEGALPAIRVAALQVVRGSVSYADESRPTEFAERLEPIEFELKDFSTSAAGGVFSLAAASKAGEKFEWHGHLSVQPVASDGELRIEGLLAHTLWTYAADRLAFAINSGHIDLQATYQFALKEAPELKVTVPTVTVSDLTVRPKNSDQDWITLPALAVSGASADLAARRAHVESVSLTGLKVVSWREADGSVNLLSLASPPTAPPAPGSVATSAPAPTPSAPSTPPVPAAASGAAASWQFDLGRFEIHDASISAEDRSTQPAAKWLLAPLSAEVTKVSIDLSKPVHLDLDTHINQSGSLTVSGDVTPQPVAFALNFKLAGVDLTAAQPYIAQYTAMTLRSGRLGGDGQLHYGAQQKPVLQFAGNVHIENLHTLDNVRQDDFIDWDGLDVLGLAYQQAPDRLDIAEITARKPYARVTIEPDSSLSVKHVLTASGGARAPSTVSAASSSAAAPTARAASPRSAGSSLKPAASRGKRAAGASAPQTAAAAPAPSMPMSIKKVVVREGSANFTDLSIKPTFSAGIQKLEGSVLGLSSKPDSRAKVDFRGSVGPYSPVTINGEVNLLSATLYTDVALTFANIELSIFNPYSGKFAGYNITKGKLTTELHYKIDNRKLDAQHHVVIDQLEFGDKTPSKDAVSLPVKLAVALLKDRNGVIDLNLPVAGSIDDPTFRLGPIIWKVIVNLLEKAVTAPFALLGRLFGAGPDLEYIEFQAGAAAPDPAGADKIKTVAKALAERPQLKIDVPIGVVPDVDRPALIAAKFTAEVGEIQGARGGRKPPPSATPTPWEQADPSVKLDLLTRLYTRDLGSAPKYPDSVTAIKGKPEATAAKIEYLTGEIRAHLSVGDAELRALGEERATALQQRLLENTQIAPERVFLVANDKASAKDGVVRLQLSLK